MQRKTYSKTAKFAFIREVANGKYRYTVKSLLWLNASDQARVYQVVPREKWSGNHLYFDNHAAAKNAYLMLVLTV